MSININHPSFISFLDNVTSVIFKEIDVKSYFNITPDKQIKIQKAVFLILKKCLKTRALIGDPEIKAFVIVFQKKNEETECYEISAILKDIIINYDKLTTESEKKKSTTTKIK